MTGLVDASGSPLRSKDSRKCDVGTCPNPAAYQVGALMWAQGMRKGSHEPMPILSSLACCESHKKFPTIKNCFPIEAQAEIRQKAYEAGKKPPDFSTAEILLSPIRR